MINKKQTTEILVGLKSYSKTLNKVLIDDCIIIITLLESLSELNTVRIHTETLMSGGIVLEWYIGLNGKLQFQLLEPNTFKIISNAINDEVMIILNTIDTYFKVKNSPKSEKIVVKEEEPIEIPPTVDAYF